MTYLIVKWVHILSSTILFGTGIGSAFYLLTTSLTRDVRAIAVVNRHVVLADWLFTTPTAIIQPLTGIWLVMLMGLPLSTPWISWSFGLYGLAIACWVPVVWMQIRMKQLAQEAADDGVALDAAYWRFFWAWVVLGFAAFIAFIAIFYLMVFKPA